MYAYVCIVNKTFLVYKIILQKKWLLFFISQHLK